MNTRATSAFWAAEAPALAVSEVELVIDDPEVWARVVIASAGAERYFDILATAGKEELAYYW